MIHFFLGLFTVYYTLMLLSYWATFLAFRFASRLPPAGSSTTALKEGFREETLPFLIAVAPTRAAAGSIRGMAACLAAQDYPRDRYRVAVVIDRDGSEDPSAQIAREAGVEVYERPSTAIRTKGAGLNDLMQQLRHEPFDAMLALDIDARLDPLFFKRTADHLRRGEDVIQCAPLSKNPGETVVARISDAAQALANMMQIGRTALGLSSILSGTGMVFSRESLQKLQWQTSTGRHISDDGELNLRCLLNEIPVFYGADLILRNDLPTDTRAVRLQRRRWNAGYVELIPSYIGPLLRKALRGDWRVFEGVFTFFILPSCSLSFVIGGLMTVVLGLACLRTHALYGWWLAIMALWILHAVYYVWALRLVGCLFTPREFIRLPAFLLMRAVAIIEGALLACHPNPGHKAAPAAHKENELS
jgi:cellulose synthase/poly-beta-1,6-N-acetylglucosamine synthase-like glycosyltransferase